MRRFNKVNVTLKSNDGIALIIVLWVVALLAIIAAEFCLTIRSEVIMTRNFKEKTDAYYLACGGFDAAVYELVRRSSEGEKTKQKTDDKDDQDQSELQKPLGIKDLRINLENSPIDFGDGAFSVYITQESGKFNLNTVDSTGLKMILTGLNVKEEDIPIISDSILDWRDTNSSQRVSGAEDNYYKGLGKPYECRDSDFKSVEELLQVRGITPEIYYNGLKDVFTVFSDDHEVEEDQEENEIAANQIDINAASRRVLAVLPGMTDEILDKIEKYRRETDFNSIFDLRPIVGNKVFSKIHSFLTITGSAYYSIQSIGIYEDSRTRHGVYGFVKIDPDEYSKGYILLEWHETIDYTKTL